MVNFPNDCVTSTPGSLPPTPSTADARLPPLHMRSSVIAVTTRKVDTTDRLNLERLMVAPLSEKTGPVARVGRTGPAVISLTSQRCLHR